jgi:hypothetical protein
MSSRLCTLALAALVAAGGAAHAQLRAIPAQATRGEIRHLQGMTVEIGGERRELAPGAQIRDADNRVVMPAALPPGAAVKYTLDSAGMVSRVWILSPAEAAAADSGK